MKLQLSLVFGLITGVLPTLNAQTSKIKPLQVSCSVEKGDCWRSLARSVTQHPSVNHFDINVDRDTGGFAVANSVMPTSREYHWFYNKKLGIVDFRVKYFEPPDNWAVIGQRSRYRNFSNEFWKKFASKTSDFKDTDFDAFAQKEGVVVSKYIVDPYPIKQGVN